MFDIDANSRLISGSGSSLRGVNTVARCSPKRSAFSLSLFAQLVSVGVCLRMGGMTSFGFFANLIGFQSELSCLLSLFM